MSRYNNPYYEWLRMAVALNILLISTPVLFPYVLYIDWRYEREEANKRLEWLTDWLEKVLV